jgi:hypothetical protein
MAAARASEEGRAMTKSEKSIEFYIPEPRMPTPEEHREISLKWLSRVQPCLIDQWPKDLAELSFLTEMIKVPDGLWEAFGDMHDRKPRAPIIDEMAAELDSRMGWNRKFVRLNSRSPKDYPWPFEVPATMSGKEAMSFLIGSERVLDDLFEFKWVPEQPAYICLREWQYGLRTTDEYRCFVKDGQLIAVTAYDYTKEQRPPEDDGKAIRKEIDAYFFDVLKPRLHIDTVVFDLWMPWHDKDKMKLIEINPYGLSDPCFFCSYANVENASSYVQYRDVADD